MKHGVLLINGLNNGVGRWYESRMLNQLKRRGVDSIHSHTNWEGNESFEAILVRLTEQARKLKQDLGGVCIVGVSAGASMAINVMSELNSEHVEVITIAGRLRRGAVLPWSYRTLERASHLGTNRASQSFYDSLTHCEDTVIPALSNKQRQNVTILKPVFDEVVPLHTMNLAGADVRHIPAVEHEIACIIGTAVATRTIT